MHARTHIAANLYCAHSRQDSMCALRPLAIYHLFSLLGKATEIVDLWCSCSAGVSKSGHKESLVGDDG